MGLFNNEEESTKSPVANFIIGILLFLGAFVLLFWNEGNYAKNITKEKFINNNVINVTEYRPENNGKLVHYTGVATTNEFIGDKDLKVRVLVLDKNAEMYQWKETRRRSGRYSRTKYYKIWSSKLYKNGRNLKSKPVDSERFEAQDIELGEFVLKPSVTKYLKTNTSYSNLPKRNNGYQATGRYYHNGNLESPEIGDIRISYSYLPINSTISIIAKQIGNSLEAQKISAGDIVLTENGDSSAEQMLTNFKKENYNNVLTYRALGLVLMFISIMCMLEPLSSLFGIIGLGWLFNFISIIPAIIISATLSSFTIAIAWVLYRPMVSISLIAAIAIILNIAHKKSKKYNKEENTEENDNTNKYEPKDQLEKELNDLMK